jgi:hypothetical protein
MILALQLPYRKIHRRPQNLQSRIAAMQKHKTCGASQHANEFDMLQSDNDIA